MAETFQCGHPKSEDNVWLYATGKQRCARCGRATNRRWRKRNIARERARVREYLSDPLNASRHNLLKVRRHTERQLTALGVEGYVDGS